jgi:hypothetical protein
VHAANTPQPAVLASGILVLERLYRDPTAATAAGVPRATRWPRSTGTTRAPRATQGGCAPRHRPARVRRRPGVARHAPRARRARAHRAPARVAPLMAVCQKPATWR